MEGSQDAEVGKEFSDAHVFAWCTFQVVIKTCFQQFSGNFTILLFHYDGRTTEWDEFEWSKQAIHVSVWKQTKW